MAESNVIVATFGDESRTYQAFSEIKRVAASGEVKIIGLTIIHRTLEGRFEVRDAAMKMYGGSIAGGLIGSLVGIMGGPLGFLLGWGAGSILGGLRDAREVKSNQTLFQRLSEDMAVGTTALVGELEEKDPNVVRQIVRRLGGELLRRPTEAVEADIAAAKNAHDSAARAAEQVFNDHSESRPRSDRTIDT